MSGERIATLASRGVSRDARWAAQRRASTNFVNDMTVIEEHYLDLEEATVADGGVYICRVSEQRYCDNESVNVFITGPPN